MAEDSILILSFLSLLMAFGQAGEDDPGHYGTPALLSAVFSCWGPVMLGPLTGASSVMPEFWCGVQGQGNLHICKSSAPVL